MRPDSPAGSDGATSGPYFVMTCEGVHPAAAIRLRSEWNGPPWMTGGVIVREVPNPIVFATDPDYPGELKPMYEGTIPLMRHDLIAALQRAGVDNLQCFPAIVQGGAGGEMRADYSAVNVVGLVACADMDASELMDTDDDPSLIDVDFASLVIDESKTGGARLFRLAEAVSAIIVHESVRDSIEGRIPGMTFYGQGEWSG